MVGAEPDETNRVFEVFSVSDREASVWQGLARSGHLRAFSNRILRECSEFERAHRGRRVAVGASGDDADIPSMKRDSSYRAMASVLVPRICGAKKGEAHFAEIATGELWADRLHVGICSV